MTVVALTIAGSDPSGGAGIQSDLRTFAALGVVGVSVITAITVQNSLGVQSVHPVDAAIVAAQLDAIFSDTKVNAVKIGMLGGAEQVYAVAAALRKYSPPNVILDPVLASTGGVPLLDDAGRHALLTELMPLCDLITPNVPELGILTGMKTEYAGEREDAARQLQTFQAQSILVKGGHLRYTPIDILYEPSGVIHRYFANRVEMPHTHGTGCILSSAIAAYLGLGKELNEAVANAKEILTKALLYPIVIGEGRGYPNLMQAVRMQNREWRTHEQRLARLNGVYLVTDTTLRPERTLEDIIWAAVDGGTATIQIREKAKSTLELVRLTKEFTEAEWTGKTLFIVNDRVDVALASDADGVHLGPDDMSPKDARRLLGPDKLVGVSIATIEEAKKAAPYVSYFGVGAIFGSKTKLDAGKPIGVERIREIKAAFPHIPLVAIGGINKDNIAEVATAGADAAAVVSAVVAAPDMEAATRELVERFDRAQETSPQPSPS